MKRNSFYKYYRVFKNETLIAEVSTNDFKPIKVKRISQRLLSGRPVDVLCSIPLACYSLPADGEMFFGYTDKVSAMKRAKSDAMTYINLMIGDVERGILKLRKYRADHYEDLNIHLLDKNIRRLEDEVNIK